METIPTIDLSGDRRAVVAALDAACTEVGFFQVLQHGVDPAVIEAAWGASRSFFDLPLADRMTVVKASPLDAYGYVPVEAESLHQSMDVASTQAADLKETFNAGPFAPPARPLVDAGEAWAFAPTRFPHALPGMAPAWRAYFDAMLDLSGRLMRSFAVALALPEDWFDPLIDESPSALRALNYPHQDRPPPPGTLRAGAHTDYGTLTILLQDDAPGGLQVFDRDARRWIDVPHVPGAFVVNLGDMLERWTNDRWRSTLHRVVNPPADGRADTRRQSMAFFHNANYHALVECLPSCLPAGGAPRHPPVLAGPHLREKAHRSVA